MVMIFFRDDGTFYPVDMPSIDGKGDREVARDNASETTITRGRG